MEELGRPDSAYERVRAYVDIFNRYGCITTERLIHYMAFLDEGLTPDSEPFERSRFTFDQDGHIVCEDVTHALLQCQIGGDIAFEHRDIFHRGDDIKIAWGSLWYPMLEEFVDGLAHEKGRISIMRFTRDFISVVKSTKFFHAWKQLGGEPRDHASYMASYLESVSKPGFSLKNKARALGSCLSIICTKNLSQYGDTKYYEKYKELRTITRHSRNYRICVFFKGDEEIGRTHTLLWGNEKITDFHIGKKFRGNDYEEVMLRHTVTVSNGETFIDKKIVPKINKWFDDFVDVLPSGDAQYERVHYSKVTELSPEEQKAMRERNKLARWVVS